MSELTPFNEDVATQIANFGDFPTIQELRQLNNIWLLGARPPLQRMSAIVLKTGDKSKSELDNFLMTMKELLPIRNAKMEILKEASPGEGFSNLHGKSELEQENEMLYSILQSVSETLVFLKINQFAALPQEIRFPKLFKLELLNHHHDDKLFRDLYQRSTNLVELKVKRLSTSGYLNCSLLSSLLDANGSRNTALLPRLSALTSECPGDSKYLVTFPQTWSKLDLWSHPTEIQDLEQLLEKNNETLINLKLNSFPTTFPKFEGVEFKFPNCFPCLQRLEISFPHLTDFNLKIRLGENEVLNYSKNFPALETLNLSFKSLNLKMLEIFWRMFFPEQVCTSLKLLEMDLKGLYSDFIVGRQNEFWYREFFPNAAIKLDGKLFL